MTINRADYFVNIAQRTTGDDVMKTLNGSPSHATIPAIAACGEFSIFLARNSTWDQL